MKEVRNVSCDTKLKNYTRFRLKPPWLETNLQREEKKKVDLDKNRGLYLMRIR